MGCLCPFHSENEDWESVSLKIQFVGSSEHLVWHRFCPMCRQHWFVMIDLPEERQVFESQKDLVREKNE
jgi:hypothetical protein